MSGYFEWKANESELLKNITNTQCPEKDGPATLAEPLIKWKQTNNTRGVSKEGQL